MNLQLCLRAGGTVETDHGGMRLNEQKQVIRWIESPGWIRHQGWQLSVPMGAQLQWPVFPFNPYKNAPETELHRAIGVLTIPLTLSEADEALSWRQGVL